MFDPISFTPKVYEVEINGELFTLCQAPLGASSAKQLLDQLIAYGARNVPTFGNACAQFRKVDFAQNLFTADTLANKKAYDPRNGDTDSHRRGLDVCFEILHLG